MYRERRRNNLAPLVSKQPSVKREPPRTYTLPEHTPGVQHTVEGFTPPTWKSKPIGYLGVSYGPKIDYQEYLQQTAERREVRLHNARSDQAIKDFEKKQAARARIKPILDPDAKQYEAERRAARRRMRGRMGTMLSQRETLGVGGIL